MTRLKSSWSLFALLLTALLPLVFAWRYEQAPAPSRDNTLSASSLRARLRRLPEIHRARPVGSAANRLLRARLQRELERLGYRSSLQRGFVCGSFGACAEVHNLVARRGPEGKEALLMAAHYDSVPAGPGVGDDAAAVVTLLELAARLRHDAEAQRDLMLLFSDGEEAGLLGARLFLERHPWAKDARYAINLEARGDTGPSLLFETSAGNRALVEEVMPHLRRPIASSLFYEVYARLPNDTDFTLFKAYGLQGFNLAFIGGVSRYHTPRDDLAHLDWRSVLHQGEHALRAARRLLHRRSLPKDKGKASHLRSAKGEDAVFFDLFAWKLIHWPASLSLWLLLLASALAAWSWRDGRREKATAALVPALLAVCAPLVALLLSVLASAGLYGVDAVPSLWIAHPWPLRIGHLAFAWATLFGAAHLLRRRAWDSAHTSSGLLPPLWRWVWLFWLTLAWLLWLTVPLAVYALLLPALAAFGMDALLPRRPRPAFVASLALAFPLLVAALVLLPIGALLYPALGVPGSALASAIWVWTFLPALSLWRSLPALHLSRLARLCGAIALLALAAQLAFPPFDRDHPQRLSLAYRQDAAGRSHWLADATWGPLPSTLRQALPFTASRVDSHPWVGGLWPLAYAAPAPPLRLPAPSFEEEGRSVTPEGVWIAGRIRSLRAAELLTLHLDAAHEDVELYLEGVRVRGLRWGGRILHFALSPPAGLRVAFRIPKARRSLEFEISDHSSALPPQGAALLALRPPWAQPSQQGDETVVSRRFQLFPEAAR